MEQSIKPNKSGREIAVDNAVRFREWIAERSSASDWADYVRGDKLNRTEIARECGFALAVLRQNPVVKEQLEVLELTLIKLGILKFEVPTDSTPDGKSSAAVNRRILLAKSSAELRVKTLEEQNAALRAEVDSLRGQLTKYKIISEHLSETGRLLLP